MIDAEKNFQFKKNQERDQEKKSEKKKKRGAKVFTRRISYESLRDAMPKEKGRHENDPTPPKPERLFVPREKEN